MTDRTELASLTVGQFGRMSQLSRKALRVYNERGLLLPARIDPESGYRYYTRAQVDVARRIRLLRLMDMSLENITAVLAAWETDPATARRLIQGQVTAVEKRVTAVQLAAQLLQEEFIPNKERHMSFTFAQAEWPAQTVVSIRRHITVPAYHQSIYPTLQQLWGHIREHGAEPSGDPIALYYGPVNEEDDGPVEICVPFSGLVPPAGEIKVRELPAHKTVQVRTFDEYNQYPKLLEMWNGLGRYVNEQAIEPNWDHDMTTYEIWHADETMSICWPVK
ncbi:MAG: MerR family transcriptional regulator [Ardenticatenaceae bacterium]|nr:MerR family transcriptional regulator [Ardenticatenaceae bacterium]